MIGDIWYRIEDYTVGTGYTDMCGEYVVTGSEPKARLRRFWVIRDTPKGVWLTECSFSFAPLHDFVMPEYMKDRSLKEWKERRMGDIRFVLHDTHKRYACESMEKALESFKARKKRQTKIFLTRIINIGRSLDLAEKGKFGG
jgi:hypothetical protein